MRNLAEVYLCEQLELCYCDIALDAAFMHQMDFLPVES